MRSILFRREVLATLKSRVTDAFSADGEVRNIDALFIISKTKGDWSVDEIYAFDIKAADVEVFNEFEVLLLDKGLFYGMKKHAEALATSFGGKFKETNYRHVLEYIWENTENSVLSVPDVVAAIENVV